MYGHDTSSNGFTLQANAGFNTFDANPYPDDLGPLTAHGVKAFVWLGAWRNASCAWEHDDAWIRSHVAPIASSPAVLAYFLGDEPLASKCPKAPAMFKARTALVHQIDPVHPTFTVISASDAGVTFPYAQWKGTTDILGFDVYPCRRVDAQCDFSRIDEAVAAIQSAGITDYWAIIQAFQDDYYRLPTPSELHEEFQHWRKSALSGYLVFSWEYGSLSLESRPDEVRQLELENSLPLH